MMSPIADLTEAGGRAQHDTGEIRYADESDRFCGDGPVVSLVVSGAPVAGVDPAIIERALARANSCFHQQAPLPRRIGRPPRKKAPLKPVNPDTPGRGKYGEYLDVTPEICRDLVARGGPGGTPLSMSQVGRQLGVSRRTVFDRVHKYPPGGHKENA